MPAVDLSFLHISDLIEWPAFKNKPTACLLVIDDAIDRRRLSSIVIGALGAGCKYFLCWGGKADELHDQIDEILEGGDDAWLSVSTVSCRGNDAEDVSISLFVATYPGRSDVRYLVITDGSVESLRNVIHTPIE